MALAALRGPLPYMHNPPSQTSYPATTSQAHIAHCRGALCVEIQRSYQPGPAYGV